MKRCTHVSGPCVDGTQAGKRCQSEATSTDILGAPVCDRHDTTKRIVRGPAA